MINRRLPIRLAAAGLAATILALWPGLALPHCDTMDGPVVGAARAALERGDPNLVLIWVQKDDEAEIRGLFDHTRAVRKLGPEARNLADRYFFETVVRLHRAGEGAPYVGLKPAGLDLGPVIPAADKALESGNAGALMTLVMDAARAGLEDRFREVVAARRFSPPDVAAGREYVRRYVTFMHYAERLYEASTGPVKGHSAELEPSPDHAHEP